MISQAVNPISITRPELNAEWVAATAEKVLAAVEEHRSTWQSWHVRAEVLRQTGLLKLMPARLIGWWSCSSPRCCRPDRWP
jgi:hypothetical protein